MSRDETLVSPLLPETGKVTGGTLAQPPTDRPLRPEIQALRALAVGLVVLYHLWPNRLSGGFVGVDVFFVISGFLIGSHLLREVRTTGRVRLGAFWARRAKRLLPASLLVLALTAAAVWIWLPLSQREDCFRQILGSALYVQNWVLGRQAVTYSASENAASPVQHYWSLSVEEQFYIVLPLILAGIAFAVRRWPRRRSQEVAAPRQGLILAVVLMLTAASFVWSVHLTTVSADEAYFSTFTRAWEFLLGVALACVGLALRGLLATATALLGAVAVMVAALTFDSGTAFPGWIALIPVLGTLALIAAGDRGPLAWAARIRPVTFLGDVSYGVYLWHWPLIVVVPAITGTDLTTLQKLMIGAGSVLLAWLSTRFIEEPIRFSPRLLGRGVRPRRVGVATVVAMAAVVGLAWGGVQNTSGALEKAQRQVERLVASADVHCLGAEAAHARSGECPDLGTVVVPDASVAVKDDGNRIECWSRQGTSELVLCPLGPTTTRGLRILAVGDSHNNSLIPAYEALAQARGWRIDVAGKPGCFFGMRPQTGTTQAHVDECAAWNANLRAYLAKNKPYDAILTTRRQVGWEEISSQRDGETAAEATAHSMQEAWAAQIARGTVILGLRDMPAPRSDVVACVERHGYDGRTECAVSRRTAMAGIDAVGLAVRGVAGAAALDLRDQICQGARCSPIIGNVMVYRDGSHVSGTMARTLAPMLGRRVDAAMERARRSLASS